tara:strand:- start:112 stop:396 length:285 start_codon:yes stop_codon:yes gene_type:complete
MGADSTAEALGADALGAVALGAEALGAGAAAEALGADAAAEALGAGAAAEALGACAVVTELKDWLLCIWIQLRTIFIASCARGLLCNHFSSLVA